MSDDDMYARAWLNMRYRDIYNAMFQVEGKCDFCGRTLPHWEGYRHKACQAVKALDLRIAL